MELQQLFRYEELPCIAEVTKILEANTSGDIYLLGGGITTQIANKQWLTNKPYRDLDFVARQVAMPNDLILPKEWRVETNSYGTLKLIGPLLTVDLWPFTKQYSVVSRGVELCIENVLKFTPLTIQSIAYNVQQQAVLGDIGLAAIKNKTVSVNCKEQAEHYCRLKGITVNDFIIDKATQLNFTPELIE